MEAIYPLMPKGVEHWETKNEIAAKIGGDLSSDAERR